MGTGLDPAGAIPTRSHPFFTASLVTASLLGVACGGDVTVEPRLGTLQVSTATSGDNPDADGYTIQLDGGQPQPIGPAAQVVMNLVEGDHTVTLAGVAANCVVAEGLTQSITVAPRTVAIAQFTVSCQDSGSSGLRWSSIALPPSLLYENDWETGQSIWGTSATDLFVIGKTAAPLDEIWHYDGSQWTRQTVSPSWDVIIGAIWGLSGTDVYAAGDRRFLRHFDGATWSDLPSPFPDDPSSAYYRGLWAAPTGDLFVAGTKGLAILHNNQWSTAALESASTLFDLGGTSKGDVWALGHRAGGGGDFETSIIAHFDGQRFKEELASDPDEEFHAIWAVAPNDVWVVGWATYAGGEILHYDGRSWSRTEPPSSGLPHLQDVWASSSTDVYAVGQGVLLHYDGTRWSNISGVDGYRIWGTSRNEVFILRTDKIFHGQP